MRTVQPIDRACKDSLDQLMPANMVAFRLGVSVRTVWRMVKRGDLPSPVHIDSALPRWRESDIQALTGGSGEAGICTFCHGLGQFTTDGGDRKTWTWRHGRAQFCSRRRVEALKS